MFKIEKGVPLPADDRPGRRAKYPFEDMDIGDSFFVPGHMKMASTISAAGRKLGMKFRYKVQTESGTEGTRVWRVALDGEAPAASPKKK